MHDTFETQENGSLQDFVERNRPKIDLTIHAICRNQAPIDDDEREQWVLNDESLYLWALDEGVNL